MESRAAMLTGPREVDIVRLPVPDTIGEDEAVLAVEACGMCGTDYEQYKGALPIAYPYIPGHEIVGRLVRIGSAAADRWGLAEGQRVAVEPMVSCGACRDCRNGRPVHCTGGQIIYGLTPASYGPGLVGGYADYMVLQPNTGVYPLPDTLTPQDAVMFNPLGAGFDWAHRVGGVGVGDTILIIGPGQRGLCSIFAAATAGASRIIVAGRGRRPWKLELATRLGATHVINSDEVDVIDAVRDITGGAMADVVLDSAPLTPHTVTTALTAARAEGTVVLAALKESGGDLGRTAQLIAERCLTVRGAWSVGDWAKQHAIEAIAAHRYPVDLLHSHVVDLAEFERVVRIQGGEIEGEDAMHVTVTGSSVAETSR